jgi:hypothetical protein
MRRPAFYAAQVPPGAPVALVSSVPAARPPLDRPLRERARFEAAGDAFLYQTVVTLYEIE